MFEKVIYSKVTVFKFQAFSDLPLFKGIVQLAELSKGKLWNFYYFSTHLLTLNCKTGLLKLITFSLQALKYGVLIEQSSS